MLVSRQSPFPISCILLGKNGEGGQAGDWRDRDGENALCGFLVFGFVFFALPIFPFPTAPCLRLRVKYLCACSPPRSQISSLFRALALNTHTYMQLNAGFDFSPGKLEG